MADGEIKVELSIEEQKALRALTTLTKKVDGFGKDAEKALKKGDIALASFAGNIAAMGASKALSFISQGFSFLTSNIGSAVDAAADQERVLNDLNTSLAITGQYTRKASQDFQDFASHIQNTTGVGDEAVLAAASKLQNIAKLNADQLKQATSASVQFAAAMGVDVETAALTVGKALEGNVGALSRYGLAVKKGGSDAETFNNVMKAMAPLAGTAESKLNTFAGATGALQGRIGDFKETLGTFVTTSPSVVSAVAAMEKGVLFLDNIFKQNSKSINAFITDSVVWLVDKLQTAADVFAYFNKVVAGGQIIYKMIEQSFFGVDVALTRVGLGFNSLIEKVKEYTGIDLGAGNKAWVDMQQASIQNSQEHIKAIDGEITAILNRTTAQNNAAKGFASLVVNETKNAINAQRQAQEAGNDAYLVSLNEKAAKTVKTEADTLDALALLRESSKGYEAQKEMEDKLNKQLMAEESYQFLVENLGREEALREMARAEELAKTSGHNAARLQLQAAFIKAQQNNIFAYQKWEDLSNKQRLENFKGTMGTLSTLQSSSSRELFMVGKASAISMATIDGIAAVQKALASAPPPFNFALAALVGTATAMNIGKIASQQPPKFESGGIVGGNSFTGDQISARVNSGEMILNRQQQTELFKQINGGSQSSGLGEIVRAVVAEMRMQPIVVQANGREIARLVRDESRSGFGVV